MIDGYESEKLEAVLPMGEFWAIDVNYCLVLLQELEGMDLVAHTDAYNARTGGGSKSSSGDTPYLLSNGLAKIDVEGVLTKKPTSMSSGTSAVEGRSLTRHATRNPDVHTLLHYFDSTPGGSVEGIEAWASDIYAARQAGKRTIAVIDGMCASASYFLASQCDEIYMTGETDVSGSIGTYTVLQDLSKMAEKRGAKIMVVAPDGYDYKGVGTPGTEITQAQVDYVRGKVTQINDVFVKAVERGRGIGEAQLQEWGGKSFVGKEAVSKGLVDGIRSFDTIVGSIHKAQALGQMRTELKPNTDTGTVAASNPPAKTGKGGKQKMDNQALSAAFAVQGLSALSTAVATAGESPEAVVGAIARVIAVEPDTRLKTLDEIGISSSEDVQRLSADAKYGQQCDAQLRTEVKALAIAALGKDKGTERASAIDRLPREFVQDARDQYTALEEARTGRDPLTGRAARQTAGGQLDTITGRDADRSNADEGDSLVQATIRARGKNGVVA